MLCSVVASDEDLESPNNTVTALDDP
jgi:hypothetical protein